MKFAIRALLGGLVLLCAVPPASAAVQVTYTYDVLGRLTGATYACGSSFTYVYDAAGNRTSIANVAPNGCAPTAVNDSLTTAFNTPSTLDPRTNDSDPVGYALTITAAGTPGHGAAVVNSGTSITYTPATGYSGADSFTYTISNGHGGTASASVAVTVTAPANQPPVAVNDSISTPQNTANSFDPRVNDSDPNGDALTITAVGTPGHGTASIVSGTSVTYTPSSGYSGSDNFTYTISDGHGGTASATVSVTVTAPANQAPTAYNDSTFYFGTTTPGHPKVATKTIDPRVNDTDPDGDALTVTAVSAAASGLATVTNNGGTSVTYTYNTAQMTLITTDSFTYTISDGHGHTATATVSISIDIEPLH